VLLAHGAGREPEEGQFWFGGREFPRTASSLSSFHGFDAPPLEFILDSGPVAHEERIQDQDARDAKTPHGSFLGFWERHGSSDAWKESVWDQYLTQPEVLLPMGLAVSAAVISHWDRRLAKQWQGLLGGDQTLGDIGVYTLIGTSAMIGVLFPGEGRNGWDEGWTIGESFLVSYLTTSVLKASVPRSRPDHGSHSFPSGHSAMAFTGATLIEQNSGPLLGLPAYGLAAFTAFERVEAGRHFPSDVLAGAAIGTLSAGVFDALHWGRGPGKGGIAGPSVACGVDAQGWHSFAFQVSIGF
jgi:membrane-associated phospholipid phosphatase